ncbi:hypothetical protein U1Q18_050285 [Sarracenia purpurea var. burkii]
MKVTEKYQECIWIMLMAINNRIATLHDTLETIWKNDTYLNRADRFCHQLSSLYQKLSNSDIHAPWYSKLAKECRPGSADYISYIQDLATALNSEDIVAVGDFLSSISSHDVNSPTSQSSPTLDPRIPPPV